MREALAARSPRDFTAAGPARRARPNGRGAAVAASLAAGVLRRPGALVGSLVIGAAAVAILVNALGGQTRRHPAPLFAEPAPPRTEAARRAEPLPLPPSRPTVAPLAPPAPSPAPPARRDAIGDLLKASDARPAAPARPPEPTITSAARPEPSRSLLLAQKALAKLGHGPLKEDGLIGPGTRQAIERFERARKIPVTGELTPRTTRELAAASGMALE